MCIFRWDETHFGKHTSWYILGKVLWVGLGGGGLILIFVKWVGLFVVLLVGLMTIKDYGICLAIFKYPWFYISILNYFYPSIYYFCPSIYFYLSIYYFHPSIYFYLSIYYFYHYFYPSIYYFHSSIYYFCTSIYFYPSIYYFHPSIYFYPSIYYFYVIVCKEHCLPSV